MATVAIPSSEPIRPGITPVPCPTQEWQPADPKFEALPGAKAFFGPDCSFAEGAMPWPSWAKTPKFVSGFNVAFAGNFRRVSISWWASST